MVRQETHARSVAKALSWRMGGSLTTVLLVWAFTREWNIAVAIGGIEIFAKLVIFYLHERVWARVRWGIVERGRG